MVWIDNTSEYFSELGTLTAAEQTTLDQLAIAAQAAIEKYLGRTIEAANYDEVIPIGNNGAAILTHFPIIYLTRINDDRITGLRIQNTSAQVANYYVDIPNSQLKLFHTSAGTEATNNIDLTSATTLSAVATAVSAVGSGWTASVADSTYNNYPSTDLIDRQYGECTTQVDVDLWDTSNQHYAIDNNVGVIDGFRGLKTVRVKYRAGYETASIPEELKKAAADLAVMYYSYNSSAGAVMSESLGDYSYSTATSSSGGLTLKWPIQNNTTLAQYKDRRI